MKNIVVRLDLDQVCKSPNEVLSSIRLLERMRDAGIPVLRLKNRRGEVMGGALMLFGVESGTLHMYTIEDLDTNEAVFEWTPPAGYKPQAKPVSKAVPAAADDDEL